MTWHLPQWLGWLWTVTAPLVDPEPEHRRRRRYDALCAIGQHPERLIVGDDRIFLRCDHCGRESTGVDVRPTVKPR
jgi:hypothetical protein